jgi:phosphoribosyl 1,2-cyclic phosphate phosphodiesterase
VGIEAIILGSGTSNGVPMLGVPYPPEFLANPKNHRTRASLMLCGPTGNLLVDCAPEMRLQVTREGITEIEAVLITHSHADHVMGMDDLRSICIRTRRVMPVYTLPRYQEDIKRIYNYAFREFPPGVEVPRFDLRDVPERLEVGGMTLTPFLVNHGSIPVVALRVNNFAYVTDVSEIPENVSHHLEGLETLILDAVRYKPHVNHFHYERALQVIERFKPKRAFLTHLSHDYDHDITNAEIPQGVELAYDRLRIEIS